MTEMFSGPASITAIEWKSLYGRLLAIFPHGREIAVTKFGESQCIRADVYDLDAGLPVSLDALIFPRALVIQLSGIQHGRAVVGRLGQGEARGGQTPPWKLSDPTPEDLAKATAYFAAHPPRSQQPAKPNPTPPANPWGTPPAQPTSNSYPAPPTQQQAYQPPATDRPPY